MKPLVTSILLTIFSFTASCQNPYDQLIPRLNDHLAQYSFHFQTLMQFRGMKDYQSGKIDYPILLNRFRAYTTPAAVENFSQDPSGVYYFDTASADLRTTALLFYHYTTGDTLHTWLLKANGIQGYSIRHVPKQELLKLEEEFKNALAADFSQKNAFASRGMTMAASTIKPAYEIQKSICNVLFSPSVLKGLTGVKHLLLFPEENIASIPLYALQPFGNNSYLVDSLAYVVAFSLDEFIKRHNTDENPEHRDRNKYIPQGVLVVGNPAYGDTCDYTFPQLPGAKQEAETFAKLFNTSVLTGADATKQKVWQQMTKSDIIYLATHAIATSDSVLFNSFVALTPDSTDPCGKLTAKEIQGDTGPGRKPYLPQHSMVILSACQTGLGKVMTAGIVGVGRAFIKGGAQNVIMSLWSINDKGTADLMQGFGTELFQPAAFFPAENLRQAILKYKAKNNDPFIWSAFVNMGTPFSPAYEMKIDNK